MSTIAPIKNTRNDCVRKPAMAAMTRLPHKNAPLSFFLAPTIASFPVPSTNRPIDFRVPFPHFLRDLLFRVLVGPGLIREPFHLWLSVRAVAPKTHLDLLSLDADLPELIRTSADELKTSHGGRLLSILVHYHLPWLQGSRKGQVG